jgi:hypothetical protein
MSENSCLVRASTELMMAVGSEPPDRNSAQRILEEVYSGLFCATTITGHQGLLELENNIDSSNTAAKKAGFGSWANGVGLKNSIHFQSSYDVDTKKRTLEVDATSIYGNGAPQPVAKITFSDKK